VPAIPSNTVTYIDGVAAAVPVTTGAVAAPA
jgi:hypothetical protein